MIKKITINDIKRRMLETKYGDEMFDSCILLKNLAIVHKEQPMSADFIYEQLLINSKYLKPIYAEMLTLYRKNNDKEAFGIFGETLNTINAKNFGGILAKLDDINPGELIEQVESCLDAITEARVTLDMRRSQRNSVITTFLSSATIFAMLLNFAVVVVFMDTLAQLKMLFV